MTAIPRIATTVLSAATKELRADLPIASHKSLQSLTPLAQTTLGGIAHSSTQSFFLVHPGYVAHPTTASSYHETELKQKAHEDHPKVNLVEMVKKANNDVYNEDMEGLLREKIQEMRVLAGLDQHTKPTKVNLSSARWGLMQIAQINSSHYPDIKAEALSSLIIFMKNDPLTEASSHGAIELLHDLLSKIDPTSSQGSNLRIQVIIAVAFGSAVTLVNQHYSKGHITKITEDLKKRCDATNKAFEKLVIDTTNWRLKWAVGYAKQAITHLISEKSVTDDVIERFSHVANAIEKAYKDKNIAGFFRELALAANGLDTIFEARWGRHLVKLVSLTNDAKTSMDAFIEILKITKQYQTSDWQFLIAALEEIENIALTTANTAIRTAAVTGCILVNKEKLPGISDFVNYDKFYCSAFIAGDSKKILDGYIRSKATEALANIKRVSAKPAPLKTTETLHSPSAPGIGLAPSAPIATKVVSASAPSSPTSPISALAATSLQSHSAPAILMPAQFVMMSMAPPSFALPKPANSERIAKLLFSCFKDSSVPPAVIESIVDSGEITLLDDRKQLSITDKGMAQLVEVLKKFPVTQLDLTIFPTNVDRKEVLEGLEILTAAMPETALDSLVLSSKLGKGTPNALNFAKWIFNANKEGKIKNIHFNNNPAGFSGIARELNLLGNIDLAISYYNKAINADRNHPDRAKFYTLCGTLLKDNKQLDLARSYWEKAIKIDPLLASALRCLSVYYSNQGLLEESIKYSILAVEAQPQYTYGHYNLGVDLFEMGMKSGNKTDFQKAKKCMQKHIELSKSLLSISPRTSEFEEENRKLISYLESAESYLSKIQNQLNEI